MLDRHGHLHDAHGRFARTGRIRVEAYELGDRPGNREPSIRRAANAFRPRRSETSARGQYSKVVDAAHSVHSAYAAVARGSVTYQQRQRISYQSPRKIAESLAKTGTDIMPIREALRRKTRLAGRGSREPRVGVKMTFTGERRVVRGYSVPAGVRQVGAARRRMGGY
jgi:hypothetical protein